MKLHHTLVEELVTMFTTFGGWKDEHRLKAELAKLDVTVYEQQSNGGNKVLVSTKTLQKESSNK